MFEKLRYFGVGLLKNDNKIFNIQLRNQSEKVYFNDV